MKYVNTDGGFRCIPEGDLDKRLLSHIIWQATGTWKRPTAAPFREPRYNVMLTVEEDWSDDGSLSGTVDVSPIKFDAARVYSDGASLPLIYWVEIREDGAIRVHWRLEAFGEWADAQENFMPHGPVIGEPEAEEIVVEGKEA